MNIKYMRIIKIFLKKLFDYVFICSKTVANDDISRKLAENKEILKDNCKIIIFQNGFANDEPF